MRTVDEEDLAALVEAVTGSAKYAAIAPDLIRSIGRRELDIRPRLKEAVKQTKRKLHQVAAAYLHVPIDYERALDDLREAKAAGGRQEMRDVCRELMRLHASTAERVPIMERFYRRVLRPLCPFRSLLDVACGLNPLSIPWMGIGSDVAYYGYEAYADMAAFLDQALALLEVPGCVEPQDVIAHPPVRVADVALVLKAIPCLEQVDKEAGATLLGALQARQVVVSFPVRSLGGRSKNMVANYEAHFRELVAGRRWSVTRFVFETELAFVVTK